MAAGLPLMKNILTPPAKNILMSLGVSPAVSAAGGAIPKKIMNQVQQH